MKNKEITQRKTKILATLGPSSNTVKKIIELSKAGASAFRLNCSHLDEKSLKEYREKTLASFTGQIDLANQLLHYTLCRRYFSFYVDLRR